MLLWSYPLLLLFLFLGYALWQWRNYIDWQACIKNTWAAAGIEAIGKTATLVAARNEAGTIGRLLSDLLNQAGRKATDEIWVVDDHSDDETASIVASFPAVRLLHLADYLGESPCIAHKKAALTYAIQSTTADWLLCTDADCRWPIRGKVCIEAAFVAGYQFVTAPVLLEEPRNFCESFQALDMAAYMLLTAAYAQRGQPILANGANMAFSRQLFEAVGGYAGVDHIASGDDVLLLQKVSALATSRVVFVADPAALVLTKPMPNWLAFWAQRLRWAGKTAAYTQPALAQAQALNFVLAQAMLLGLLLAYWWPVWALVVSFVWVAKGALDYVLLRSVCRHFHRPHWMNAYPLVQLLHPVYLVAIGWATLLGWKSKWKGR